jgi:UDP-N-acetylmuramoyl-tripeptide--D-alanyl-D-alanine ligase
MNNFFKRLIFLIKKGEIILVTGRYYKTSAEAIYQVLKHLDKKVEKINFPFSICDVRRVLLSQILIIGVDHQKIKKLKKALPLKKIRIVVITPVGEIPVEEIVFSGERNQTKDIVNFLKNLLPQSLLLLNYDDEAVREIDDFVNLKDLTFGFDKGADLRATDIIIDEEGTNFKLNFEGNVIPIWLNRIFGKEQIYAALSSLGVSIFLGINLLEASDSLKFYQSIPGKMRLIEGIKRTLILDDSENASVFSMLEGITILGQIGKMKRKIAVLGDILGIGKYTIEAHEVIGEKVAQIADLLFTVGPRAKFIAQGAEKKGFPKEKIFSFDKLDEARLAVQKEIKEGDIVLVDGARELRMQKIVGEIKKIV